MVTWNAVYVRDPSILEETSLQSIRRETSGAVTARRWRDWTELELSGLQEGEALAGRLSLETGVEVISVRIQTTSNVLGIVHHEAGKVSRRLAYSDGAWREVEGTPRPWEASALFSERKLEDALSECEGDEDEAWVRQVFQERILTVGAFEPHPDEFECLWAVLSMDAEQWQALRESAPVARVEGVKGRGRVWLARALLLGAVLSALLLVGTGQPRFFFLAGVLLTGGGWVSLQRWSMSGRWLS